MIGDAAPHVVLSDPHYPFQSKRCMQLALQFIRDHQPSTVHCLGDWVDMYSVSRFSRDPRRRMSVIAEAKAARGGLEDVRNAAPKAEILFSEGNHENRLDRFLIDKAPELLGLEGLDIPSILKFDEYGIKYHTLLKPYRIGHLLFYHGSLVKKHSGMTAAAHVDMFGSSTIIGHTHRQGTYYRTSMRRSHVGVENGCLCNPPDYTTAPNWQRGFSVVWFDGPLFHVEQVPIINNRYVYHGKAYGTKNTTSAAKAKTKVPARVPCRRA
jgi:predicted phosphodiesterase